MQKVIVSVALDPADAAKLQAVRRSREVIPSLSAVAREMLLTGLTGGGVSFTPPVLVDVYPGDIDEVREAMDGPAGTRPSLAFSRALLRFYDEVMAMTGGAPPTTEPKNAAGFTAAEQAEIDAYAAKAQAEAPVAQVVPFRGAGSR